MKSWIFLIIFCLCIFIISTNIVTEKFALSVIDRSVTKICNSKKNLQCLEPLKNPIILSEKNTKVTIYTKVNCCVPNIFLQSIKRKKEKIVIKINEKTHTLCDCGEDLWKIDLKFEEKLDPKNLEIFKINGVFGGIMNQKNINPNDILY